VLKDNGHGPEEPEPAPSRAKAKAKPLASQRYVRRGVRFTRADEQELIPGEPLYVRQPNVSPPRFVRAGRVKAATDANV
jgi:hypothetical protein